MVRHDHLARAVVRHEVALAHHLGPRQRTHDRPDRRAARQLDVLDLLADHLAGLLVAVGDELERLGCAAPQAVHRRDVAAADVLQELADGRLRGRDRDVDLAALHQVGVRAAVDQGDHPARAHPLGEQRAHDVVLVVVREREEEIHLADVLALEQLLVGRVALQDQRRVQAVGDVLRADLVELDDLDLILLLQRQGEAQADVAPAGDHQALHRLVHLAQLAHHLPDVLGVGDAEHLVAGLHDGVAVGDDRLVAAEDRRHARVDVGQMLAHVLQGKAHERPALHRPHRHHRHAAAREIEDLQRLGELDQPRDRLGDDVLGADRVVDREALVGQELGAREDAARAHARDPRGHVEQHLAHLARRQVGLVGLRDRDQEVGVLDAGLDQRARMRREADDRAQVEPVLEVLESPRIDVDDGDVVLLGDEALGERRADLARAHD
jgi:hypothetical protein